MKTIKVMVVDDSAFVRKALQRIFDEEPDIEVVASASSGAEAIEKAVSLNPDVITLDILMPGMDGIETLKALMERHPTPVLMLSQLTKEGAELTLKALELGAMDFVDKSAAGVMDFFVLAKEIRTKVRSIAGSRPVRMAGRQEALVSRKARGACDIVAVGASTGGPLALQILLSKFPRDIDFGLVVVQHMPHGFTGPLAKRLDSICNISVKEAEEGDSVMPGTALIAPAGLHMTVKKSRTALETGHDGSKGFVKLDLEPLDSLHRPSIDVLFNSAARQFGERSIGVILTGMGSDGANGLGAIKETGGYTIAQDEGTSAIFGMPRVAIERGFAEAVLPITGITEEILRKA